MRICLLLALAVAPSITGAEPAGPVGLVVLRDGSCLRLQEPPRLRGELLELILYPSGLARTVALDALDAEATETANRDAPPGLPRPTVTWGTSAAAPTGPLPSAEDQQAERRLSERLGRDAVRLQEERRQLRRAVTELEEDARRFERDLQRNLTAGRFAGALAEQCRRVAALRDTMRQRLDLVEAELAAIYERAARESLALPTPTPP